MRGVKGERFLKTIIAKYNEVESGKAEKLINDALQELSKENKVVSISFHNAGFKPLNLICNIWYEQGTSGDKHTRFIKTVSMTINEINENNSIIEDKVNTAVKNIIENGGKIINFIHHNFGLSSVLVLYDIIYEAEKPIG